MSDSTAAEVRDGAPSRRPRRAIVLGTVAFAAISAAVLSWAKWFPYWHKLGKVAASHTLGRSILTGRAANPPAPSWHAAISFAFSYGRSIWVALVAGLVLAASVEAFLPSRRLLAMFQLHRGRVAGCLAGGLLAMPSMMCTCCAAPVAASIRRRGVPIGSALAYWIANPVLNPAALAFMAIVLPWQFVTVRLVTGAVLVFGIAMLVARLSGARQVVADPQESGDRENGSGVVAAVRRFLAALLRFSVTMIPEYVIVVLILGGLRGWLFPLGGDVASSGLLAVVLFAVVGTLFVIPTAGETPIIQGLASSGIGAGPLGALVLTLPAVSLPSMIMVRRSFPARAIGLLAGCVAGLGVAGAALLVLLP
jgi:uncharacterized protein